jgi:hypothetical protein
MGWCLYGHSNTFETIQPSPEWKNLNGKCWALTLSDRRSMGMQVVNEDQYTPATCYGAGTHTLTREMVVIVRFFVDFSNEEDVRQIHALQDEIRFSQKAPGTFEVPTWDEASLKTGRSRASAASILGE